MRRIATTWVLAAVASVLAVPAHGNLLFNAGFETNSGAGGSADWWANSGASGTEPWANYSGDWGMAIHGWGTNYGAFYQDYGSGQAGYQYTFSIWACKDIGIFGFEASNTYLTLEFRDGGDSLLTSASNDIYGSLSDTWQQFSVSGTAPSNTAKVRATVDIPWLNNDGAGAAKFDEGSLTAIPEPTAIWSVLWGTAVVAARAIRRRK